MAGDAVDIRACIDRFALPRSHDERMALITSALWESGDTILISFLDGDPSVQERVKAASKAWLNHANLQFSFRQEHKADIRISFQRQGSWSYIGTQCRLAGDDEPTMNYGWLTTETADDEVRRVVLHEFGHALGCIHEHQNPDGGIKWKKDVVYAYYAGDPNFWSKEQVDQNLFKTYDENVLHHTKVDPTSIMMYPIDPHFTEDGFSVGLNTDLSETDRMFMRQNYP